VRYGTCCRGTDHLRPSHRMTHREATPRFGVYVRRWFPEPTAWCLWGSRTEAGAAEQVRLGPTCQAAGLTLCPATKTLRSLIAVLCPDRCEVPDSLLQDGTPWVRS